MFALLIGILGCLELRAQGPTPGQNVNMVSGTKYPGGDPALQRQNEPSIAVSTRNPLHLLAAANDYRTVDLPLTDTLPNLDQMAGDAWLGIFKSFDGGQTWQSILHPGFPQDQSALGLSSPLKGLNAASDPVIRAGVAGFFGMTGIAFNRTQNQGVVFFTRFLDLNNKENGDVTAPNTSGGFGRDPIRYIDTKVITTGNAGQFLDKPWLAIDIPRGASQCTLNVPQSGGTVQQMIPAGNIYLAYSVFVGNTDVTVRTKIYLTRSTDCGNTWSTPTKLTEGYPVNQGAQIAIDPKTGAVYVVWRQFASTNQQDGINFVVSTDGGQTFTKGQTIWSLPAFSLSSTQGSFFDEGTTGGEIRTNAFPSVAVGDNGTVYVAWSQRNAPGSLSPNSARIVYTSSSNGGLSWSSPTPIDDCGIANDSPYATFTSGVASPCTSAAALLAGHQLMPSLTFVQGKLMFLYYDQRLDHTLAYYTPSPNNAADGTMLPDANGKFFSEERDVKGSPHDDTKRDSQQDIFNSFLSDYSSATLFTNTPMYMNRRHTIEVRLTTLDVANGNKVTSAYVSQYKFGRVNDPLNPAHDVSGELQQLEVNPPNLPLYKNGSMPFLGDYIEVTAPTMVQNGGIWRWNTAPAPSAPLVAYASWTSNQNVRPPADGNWSHYTPPTFFNDANGSITSNFDPTQPRPTCVPGQEGMRNQDIYSSRITQGLVVSSPQNVKPFTRDTNGNLLQRAFVVLVQNYTDTARSFRLTTSQPANGFASFIQGPNPIPAPPFTFITASLDVTVPPGSGVARSVFAASSTSLAPFMVAVNEISAPGALTLLANGLQGFVNLNSDPTSPQLVNPDNVSGIDIASTETYTPIVVQTGTANPNPFNPNPLNVGNPNPFNPNPLNPNPFNPNPLNPNPLNPNPLNADIADPNPLNPNPLNPNPFNTDPTNTAVFNPNPLNPNPLNPNPLNSDLTNAAISDSTSTVTNTGNTTAGYKVKLFSTMGSSSSPTLQLIVSKTYTTPAATGCSLYQQQQPVVLANVNTATVDNISNLSSTSQNPNPGDATFSLAPGDTALITIRGLGLSCHANINNQTDPSFNRCSDRGGNTATFIEDVVRNTVPVVFQQASNTNINTDGQLPSPSFSAPIFISTTSLPETDAGQQYNATLVAVGGVQPLTWSISNGSLPPGFALNSATGTITNATPLSNAEGTYNFIVQVTDANGQSFQRALSIVMHPPLVITTASLPDVLAGFPYTSSVAATGGKGPYNWAVTSGALPAGLLLASGSGAISGTETTAGGATFTVTLTDALSNSQSKQFTISEAGITFSGFASDPQGDTTSGGADLESASINYYSADVVEISVQFYNVNPLISNPVVLLDTDQNPATGSAGINGGCTIDTQVIGVDAIVNFQPGFGNGVGVADILRATGGCNNFVLVGTPQFQFLPSGALNVRFARSLIDPTGALKNNFFINFKVYSDLLLGPGGGFTGILDTMPDVGLPAAQTFEKGIIQ